MLITRIITALILGSAVIAAVFLLPAAPAAAFFALLWLVGAWEWAGLCGWERGSRFLYTALAAAALLPALWVGVAPLASTLAAVLALLWWLTAFVIVLRFPVRVPTWGIAFAGAPALIPSWLALFYLLSAPQGAALAFTSLVLVWAADVGAYCAGRTLGRVKLAPRVSPGKTWEGLAGGVALAAIAAWAAAAIIGLPPAPLVAIGIATALVSVVGDLTISVFKRQSGLKDTGRLLPGHGGVMDRIDSLVAALPIYLLGLKLAGWLP